MAGSGVTAHVGGTRQSPRGPRSTSLPCSLLLTDVVCSRREKEERKHVRSLLPIHPCSAELQDFTCGCQHTRRRHTKSSPGNAPWTRGEEPHACSRPPARASQGMVKRRSLSGGERTGDEENRGDPQNLAHVHSFPAQDTTSLQLMVSSFTSDTEATARVTPGEERWEGRAATALAFKKDPV